MSYEQLTISADGNSAVFGRHSAEPLVEMVAFGTFGSGTLKLQGSYDGTNFVDITGASLTAAGYKNATTLMDFFRVNLNGATGASITVQVR